MEAKKVDNSTKPINKKQKLSNKPQSRKRRIIGKQSRRMLKLINNKLKLKQKRRICIKPNMESKLNQDDCSSKSADSEIDAKKTYTGEEVRALLLANDQKWENKSKEEKLEDQDSEDFKDFEDYVDYESDEGRRPEIGRWPCLRCKEYLNKDQIRNLKLRNIWGVKFICNECLQVVEENLPCLKEVLRKIANLFGNEMVDICRDCLTIDNEYKSRKGQNKRMALNLALKSISNPKVYVHELDKIIERRRIKKYGK